MWHNFGAELMGRVIVAGSINMDVVATADRHPKVGETVAGKDVFYFPGGKGANQAVAAAKLGAPTTLIGCLGRDTFGRDVKAFLTVEGVDVTLVREIQEAQTGAAVITVADADNTIVVIPGANALLNVSDVTTPSLAKGDVTVSQFEIPLPTIEAFFAHARAAGATTILNPAPAVALGRELFDLVDILILNETELGFLTKLDVRETHDQAIIIDAARSLQANGDKVICVTLGKRGIIALVNNETLAIAGRVVKAIDPTGAGDCFVGAVAAQLAGGIPMIQALEYANMAASICVQRIGAAPSMPSMAELAVASQATDQAGITRSGR
jgi:ribokinase